VIWDDQRSFLEGGFDSSEEVSHVGEKPKCADFDYMDIEPGKVNRKVAGSLLDPGRYTIWSGKRAAGEIGVSNDWRAYGPFTLEGGISYLFDVYEGTLKRVAPEELSPMLDQVDLDQARLWYKRSTVNPYVVCVERVEAT
jgi:hypothetical protein